MPKSMPGDDLTMAPPSTALTAAILALAAIAAACAGQPEQPEPRAVAGCHFFVQDDAARDLRLPWGIRLTDSPLQGWPAIQQRGEVRLATTLTGRDEVDFPFGYWIRTAADSLEIGYPAGGGLLLELAIHNGTFRGTARPVGDLLQAPGVVTEPAARPVQLTHARCPEE